ncbi:hypothetical protein LCGC14_2281160 [marine sediment metagenome]|uniref:Uncharacterized protein n=1 Tax=marine sediment metagenome TaxID=412755 RepID=A0A0F9CUM2_9ZZZZ
MGRASQMIQFINEPVIPTELETRHHYTHINRSEAKMLRRKALRDKGSLEISTEQTV